MHKACIDLAVKLALLLVRTRTDSRIIRVPLLQVKIIDECHLRAIVNKLGNEIRKNQVFISKLTDLLM